jgi:AraC-like DNA-binding protein
MTFTYLHGIHTERCAAHVDKRYEGYFTLQLMTQGCVELEYDGARRVLTGQCLWPGFPGPHIRFRCAPGHDFWEHRYVAFRGSRVDEWIAQGLFPFTEQKLPTTHNLSEQFDRIHKIASSAIPHRDPDIANRVERILLDLKELAEPAHREDWLSRAAAELDSVDRVDVRALSKTLGMSYSSFRRRFREEMDVSPHQYQLAQSMQRAKELLRDRTKSIEGVAGELGYCDIYYFSRYFKQQIGLSPSAYRKSLW